MAKVKFDPNKIDGFEKMTADEKVAALLGQEIEIDAPTEQADVLKLKNALNKACEEAGNYRKQLREKQTEQERIEAERAEKDREREELLKSLLEEKREATYKAKFMAIGYDSDTAEVLAKSLPEGVSDEYFQATKSFLDAQRKNAEIAALGKQPGLSVGTPHNGMTKEDEIVATAMKYAGL